MKYIVRTEGKVYDYKRAAYAIEAADQEEAEKIARQRFEEEYIVASDLKISSGGVRPVQIISLFSLAAAVILSLTGFRAGAGAKAPVIRPDLMSVLYAAGIFLILYIKFKGAKSLISTEEWKQLLKDRLTFAASLLLILVIAAFIQLMFSEMSVGFSFLSVHLDFRILALGLALVAYFGSGLLSLICLLLLIVLSKMSLSGLAGMLGNVKGILFLIFSVTGIVAYLISSASLSQGLMNLKGLFRNEKRMMRRAAEKETAEQ